MFSARLVIASLYDGIVERVNAMIVLEMPTPEAFEFAKELNGQIQHYESVLSARKGHKEE